MADASQLTDLARLVKTTRDLQRRYFATKRPSALSEARDAERRLDRVVEEILNPATPELFDGGQGR